MSADTKAAAAGLIECGTCGKWNLPGWGCDPDDHIYFTPVETRDAATDWALNTHEKG